MDKLFGIPMTSLVVVLGGAFALVLGTVVVLAARNRVFFRLAIRNVERRRGRSALVVVGLMLGTAIIAAALATGDTMSRTIRTVAVASLGNTDEVVSVAGAEVDWGQETGPATGVEYFAQSHYREIARALEGSPLVDGVAPAIIEPVAVVAPGSRQSEPRVTLFATDPAATAGFGVPRSSNGDEAPFAALRPGEAYLNRDAADDLEVVAGDAVRVLAGSGTADLRVRAVVDYDGSGTDGAAVLMPLAPAQELLDRQAMIRHVLISNRGGETSGAGVSDEVVQAVAPTAAHFGLAVDPAKADVIELADDLGSAFMSFFTTFGSFSIAAGILLIFLIFVMLAAERRGELGIARAVGTQRRHLVQLFLFEGVVYSLVAAAVGVLVGIGVAYGMVVLMAGALSEAEGIDMVYAVEPGSVVVAYAIGVLLTFVVVTVSAWRVSRMNIVTAIRNLPDPPATHSRWRGILFGGAGLALGALIVVSGLSANDAVTLSLGVTLGILGLVPLARAAGVSQRLARTLGGLALIAWYLLPADVFEWLFGDMSTNFSIFIVAGLGIVVGATWVLMENADVLLGLLSRVTGRFRRQAPVFKMAMAYPLRSLFRTAVTLAMFTLVVFTLVVGATTSGAFTQAFNDLDSFGGGFDVRATTSPVTPITDMSRALDATEGVDASTFEVVSSQSLLPAEAKQVGAAGTFDDYPVRGLDDAFLDHTTFQLAARATGYGSTEAVWRALKDRPGLAVVDVAAVPRREAFVMAGDAGEAFALEGFFLEDGTFDPIPVDVRDPQTGKTTRLTVIGVLSETAPLTMAGLATSQTALTSAFGYRVEPTIHLFALRDGVDAAATAEALEASFLANGFEADALEEVLADTVAANLTFNRLVQGFMGLGLIVGVAALGVISARSVVERRQQIGVLRAVGFRKGMVQLSFLLESSFIALTSIAIGTALGLLVSLNIILDSREAPSWSNLRFDVPWLNLGVIFLAVYLVALAATFLPALRASRVYPAEALRYQ